MEEKGKPKNFNLRRENESLAQWKARVYFTNFGGDHRRADINASERDVFSTKINNWLIGTEERRLEDTTATQKLEVLEILFQKVRNNPFMLENGQEDESGQSKERRFYVSPSDGSLSPLQKKHIAKLQEAYVQVVKIYRKDEEMWRFIEEKGGALVDFSLEGEDKKQNETRKKMNTVHKFRAFEYINMPDDSLKDPPNPAILEYKEKNWVFDNSISVRKNAGLTDKAIYDAGYEQLVHSDLKRDWTINDGSINGQAEGEEAQKREREDKFNALMGRYKLLRNYVPLHSQTMSYLFTEAIARNDLHLNLNTSRITINIEVDDTTLRLMTRIECPILGKSFSPHFQEYPGSVLTVLILEPEMGVMKFEGIFSTNKTLREITLTQWNNLPNKEEAIEEEKKSPQSLYQYYKSLTAFSLAVEKCKQSFLDADETYIPYVQNVFIRVNQFLSEHENLRQRAVNDPEFIWLGDGREGKSDAKATDKLTEHQLRIFLNKAEGPFAQLKILDNLFKVVTGKSTLYTQVKDSQVKKDRWNITQVKHLSIIEKLYREIVEANQNDRDIQTGLENTTGLKELSQLKLPKIGEHLLDLTPSQDESCTLKAREILSYLRSCKCNSDALKHLMLLLRDFIEHLQATQMLKKGNSLTDDELRATLTYYFSELDIQPEDTGKLKALIKQAKNLNNDIIVLDSVFVDVASFKPDEMLDKLFNDMGPDPFNSGSFFNKDERKKKSQEAYQRIENVSIQDIVTWILQNPDKALAFLKKKHWHETVVEKRNFRKEIGEQTDLLAKLVEAAETSSDSDFIKAVRDLQTSHHVKEPFALPKNWKEIEEKNSSENELEIKGAHDKDIEGEGEENKSHTAMSVQLEKRYVFEENEKGKLEKPQEFNTKTAGNSKEPAPPSAHIVNVFDRKIQYLPPAGREIKKIPDTVKAEIIQKMLEEAKRKFQVVDENSLNFTGNPELVKKAKAMLKELLVQEKEEKKELESKSKVDGVNEQPTEFQVPKIKA